MISRLSPATAQIQKNSRYEARSIQARNAQNTMVTGHSQMNREYSDEANLTPPLPVASCHTDASR